MVFFFRELSQNYICRLKNNETFYIGDVKFSKEGVTIKISGIMREEEKFIYWNELETNDYNTYFMIYSKSDAKNINRGYSYMNDWNTDLLYNVIRTTLNEKASQ